MMGAFWTTVAQWAYVLASLSGWRWPRRIEAWGWHRASEGAKEQR